MRKAWLIFAWLTCISCSTEIPCYSDDNFDAVLEEVLVENTTSRWNCGLERWEADKKAIKEICGFLTKLEERRTVSLQISRLKFDIYLHRKEKSQDVHLRLYYTHEGIYVFVKGSKQFSQDDLAEFLVKSLNVKNLDPNLCE